MGISGADLKMIAVEYSANSRSSYSALGSLVQFYRNVMKSRDFIWQLLKRDLFASYKKTLLGYTWMLISPIVGILSWVIMNSAGILKPGDVGVPYPAYILMGTMMWGLFMSSYNAAAGTLTSGADIIQQINYPHEVMLVKQLAQQLVGFSINLAINIIILFALHVIPSWHIILLPIVILPILLLAAAIGLWVAMITVLASDIANAINIVLGFIIYLIPVIYAKNVQNTYLALALRWNPLSYLICSARDIVLHGRLYGATGFAIASVASAFLFVFSLRCFYLLEHRLIERIA